MPNCFNSLKLDLSIWNFFVYLQVKSVYQYLMWGKFIEYGSKEGRASNLSRSGKLILEESSKIAIHVTLLVVSGEPFFVKLKFLGSEILVRKIQWSAIVRRSRRKFFVTKFLVV